MESKQRGDFGHEDRRRIYEYLQEHGETPPDDVRDALHIDPSGMRHHLAILKRDGYLEERDGIVAVGFVHEEAEEFTEDDVDFVIRQANQSDLTGIVGVIRQVTSDRSYVVAESVADLIDYEDVVNVHNELESRMVFVAVVDDDVVGWVHLQSPESSKLHHTAELTVGVLEGYRGHGIGSHLLHRAIEWAKKQGYQKLYNSVPSSNQAAIDFLERYDWEVEAVREDHYRLDDEYLDEVMMAYRL